MSEEIKALAKELEDIGLSEKEAKVYLATLELGQETVQNISKKANVNRATTYVVLESLQKKGIVTTFEQNKKTHFVAEGPSALYNIIREQQEELEKKDDQLDEMMNELMSVYNLHPDKPEVKFYEGKEGLKEMIIDRQNDKPKEIRVFYPVQQMKKFFSEEESKNLSGRSQNKKIRYRAYFSEYQKIERPYIVPKMSKEPASFTSDIEIWDDKVLIASLEGQISGVIIKNQNISETMKSIFEIVFSNGIPMKRERD